MSIIQQHTSATLGDGWRTINIDALNEDSSVNFDTSTLHPPQPEVSEAEVRQLAGQVRQLLRGGDAEGALRGCLETPVYNGTDAAKVRIEGIYMCQRNSHDIGCPSPDHNRSLTVHQGQRHEPAPKGHL